MWEKLLLFSGTDLLYGLAFAGVQMLRIRPFEWNSLTEPFDSLAGQVEDELSAFYLRKITSWLPFPEENEQVEHDTGSIAEVRKAFTLRYFAYHAIRLMKEDILLGNVVPLPLLGAAESKVAKGNADFLWSVIHRYDWPSEDMFGITSHFMAWQIAMDSGDQLQDFYFNFGTDVSKSCRVHALDAITYKKFGWQRFGTYVEERPQSSGNGILCVVPGLKSPETVDELRSGEDLEPLATAMKRWERFPQRVVSLPKGYKSPK